MEGNYVGVSRAQDQVQIQLWLFRHYTYYVAKVLTPLLMIAMLTLASFWFRVDELEARLAHCITLLLSTLALLFTIASDIPKLPYSTSFDKLILITLFFNGQGCLVAVVLVQIIEAHTLKLTEGNTHYDRIYSEDRLELAEQVNGWWFWFAAVSYGLGLLYIFIPKIYNRATKLAALKVARGELQRNGAVKVVAQTSKIRRDPSCQLDAHVRRASLQMVKGITLKGTRSHMLNFDSIVEMKNRSFSKKSNGTPPKMAGMSTLQVTPSSGPKTRKLSVVDSSGNVFPLVEGAING
jgi:hypothetical protein